MSSTEIGIIFLACLIKCLYDFIKDYDVYVNEAEIPTRLGGFLYMSMIVAVATLMSTLIIGTMYVLVKTIVMGLLS